MKYKNVTEGVLNFRANDVKGIKKEFELKPGKVMESDRELRFGGLELVNEEVKSKKTKEKVI